MKLYAFDFDDSLAYTDNVVRTRSGEAISTLAYAREKPELAADPFANFLDVRDTKVKRGPTFVKFERANTEGNPVAIISARSNEPEDFETLLKKMATGNYEDCSDVLKNVFEALPRGGSPVATTSVYMLPYNLHLYPCNSAAFAVKFPNLATASVAEKKCAALEHFYRLHPGASSLGFSDDDPSNLVAVQTLFARLSREAPHVRFSVFKTETPAVSPLFRSSCSGKLPLDGDCRLGAKRIRIRSKKSAAEVALLGRVRATDDAVDRSKLELADPLAEGTAVQEEPTIAFVARSEDQGEKRKVSTQDEEGDPNEEREGSQRKRGKVLDADRKEEEDSNGATDATNATGRRTPPIDDGGNAVIDDDSGVGRMVVQNRCNSLEVFQPTVKTPVRSELTVVEETKTAGAEGGDAQQTTASSRATIGSSSEQAGATSSAAASTTTGRPWLVYELQSFDVINGGVSYFGSTSNWKARRRQHETGNVITTKKLFPSLKFLARVVQSGLTSSEALRTEQQLVLDAALSRGVSKAWGAEFVNPEARRGLVNSACHRLGLCFSCNEPGHYSHACPVGAVAQNLSASKPLASTAASSPPYFPAGSQNDPSLQGSHPMRGDALFTKYRECGLPRGFDFTQADLIVWLEHRSRSTPQKPMMYYGHQAQVVNVYLCADWSRYPSGDALREHIELAARNPLEEQLSRGKVAMDRTQIRRLRGPPAKINSSSSSNNSCSANRSGVVASRAQTALWEADDRVAES